MKKTSILAIALTAFCAVTAQAADAGGAISAPQPVVIQPSAAQPAVTSSQTTPAPKSGKSTKKSAPKPKPKKKPASK